jgi:hypothetical protein
VGDGTFLYDEAINGQLLLEEQRGRRGQYRHRKQHLDNCDKRRLERHGNIISGAMGRYLDAIPALTRELGKFSMMEDGGWKGCCKGEAVLYSRYQ